MKKEFIEIFIQFYFKEIIKRKIFTLEDEVITLYKKINLNFDCQLNCAIHAN